jgi:hypothetical protein
MPDAAASRRALSPLGLLWGAIGLALFAITVRQTGLAPILEGIQRVGAGFPVILAIAGARLWLRAVAWRRCTDAPQALPLADAFRAMVAGDALGNLTPLGLLASEPAKAAFVRPRLSLMAALSGIAIENLLYTLSVAAIIAGGTVALLFTFDVPRPLEIASLVAMSGVLVIVLAGTVVLARGWRVLSRIVGALDRRAPAALRSRLEKLRAMEDQVYGFNARHPGRLAQVLLADAAFHLLAIAEVWLTLALLTGAWPGLLTTFVLEAVNRTITVAFKFVPLRLGVDEAGTELLTRTLSLPSGLGVTMAIVRKARVLFWSAIGIAFLTHRGLRRGELAGS